MAVSKLTCPECKKVLRPAKPLPPGKSVKCPQCGTLFTAVEDEEPAAPVKKVKKAAPGAGDAERKPKKPGGQAPAIKPAAKKAAPEKKPAAPRRDDDEDGGGTYGFVDTGHEEEDKPDIEYAPDMSIKDLRGPAQGALNRPSNALILVGALGFFGWVGLLVVILIPTLFPIESDSESDKTKPPKPVVGIERGLGAVADDKPPPAEITSDPNRKSIYSFFGFDLAKLGALGALFILALTPIFLGMAYSAVVAYGAVRVQNLEGYGWGMASSIMAMLPLNSWGLMVCTTLLLQFVLGMAVDDPKQLYGVLIGAIAVEALAGIGVGAWVLVTLRSERVIKGFEYKPD